jgi:hypothetical protein
MKDSLNHLYDFILFIFYLILGEIEKKKNKENIGKEKNELLASPSCGALLLP